MKKAIHYCWHCHQRVFFDHKIGWVSESIQNSKRKKYYHAECYRKYTMPYLETIKLLEERIECLRVQRNQYQEINLNYLVEIDGLKKEIANLMDFNKHSFRPAELLPEDHISY